MEAQANNIQRSLMEQAYIEDQALAKFNFIKGQFAVVNDFQIGQITRYIGRALEMELESKNEQKQEESE